MAEQRANFAQTTVAGGGYTAGSGVLNVVSTSTGSGLLPFSASGVFSVDIKDQTTKAPKALLTVTGINSSTQFAVTSEGVDVNCVAGDIVQQVQTARTLATLPVSTQASVTGSRVAGTVYQNTGTNPMFVFASIGSDSSANTVIAYSDSSNPPTTAVAATHTVTAGANTGVTFIVLPGNFYKVIADTGTPTVLVWVEWQ